ncbi:NADH-quinone oxidoreductase subunit C, partial [Halomonas sp. BBD48]|nr:NADH-quinone oxidoreductase subunit C [Halomonas sp. BBD48]
MSVATPHDTTANDAQADPVVVALMQRFGERAFVEQATLIGMPVLWVARDSLIDVLRFLREMPEPFEMLFDLSATDERLRGNRQGLPDSDFTVFYQLLSVSRNRDIMLKVALAESDLEIPSSVSLYPNANWYEREVWDMFGVTFHGHPHLTRILMPPTWMGHPLRKDHAARATEFDPYTLTVEGQDKEQQALKFDPEAWGMRRGGENSEFMFLNLGPNHPSAHGAFRIVLQLEGEEIIDCVPDIGYHHRGAEKMGERQSWHSYIPYT